MTVVGVKTWEILRVVLGTMIVAPWHLQKLRIRRTCHPLAHDVTSNTRDFCCLLRWPERTDFGLLALSHGSGQGHDLHPHSFHPWRLWLKTGQSLVEYSHSFAIVATGYVWKCLVYPIVPKPNGFADSTIPFLQMASYHWGFINPTFSDKPTVPLELFAPPNRLRVVNHQNPRSSER